jgi:hypothetical protein
VSTGRIRRAQLVTPFGVGALSVLVNGASVITAGLDHWYDSADPGSLRINEFVVDEWRLQERLKVKQLRLPPDRRTGYAGRGRQWNLDLVVPVLRFPRWSFCIYCKRLERSPLSMAQAVRCPDSKHQQQDRSSGSSKEKRKGPIMSQVPFIAICERGHLDDFPFNEWVHQSLKPTCQGPLRLLSRGGGTLAGQVIACDNPTCKAERSLEGVLQGSVAGETTALTDRLSKKEGQFSCTGSRPWVADPGSACGRPLHGALRAAGNVYFPKVESSIFLPRYEGGASAEVLDMLRRPDVQPIMQLLQELLGDVPIEKLRQSLPLELLKPFSDAELQAGLAQLTPESAPNEDSDDGEELTSTVVWRKPEYELLRSTPSDPDLAATDPGTPSELRKQIGRVRSVHVLRETRALRGFTRVRDGGLPLSQGKALLRSVPLPPQRDWLPAYVVKGEGIYLELNSATLGSWEDKTDVQSRAARITRSFQSVQHARGLQPRDITARLVLVHTMSHLLINELVYTCGYSSASLRERLYISGEAGSDMAGVLIYTAAGDSEGTMGGLVRMARPENLSTVFDAAMNRARWCSTDPVCMELGEAGQGPDSCNLAACHGCALLPETSCEEFNRFLDRGLTVGTFDLPDLGYFSA